MLPHMLSGADMVLVSQVPEVVDIVFPSKLVTALAAGAFVVVAAAADSEAARVVRDNDLGWWIPAGDATALEAVIDDLRAGRLDCAGYRQRAREYALRTFSRQSVYGPIATSLTGGKPDDAKRTVA